MATIQINKSTFRIACCDGHKPADVYEEFDANSERILAVIADKARAAGHELVVLPNATGAASYTVSADSQADEQDAHDFMHSDDADFWRHL